MHKTRTKSGFTLVELTISVGIFIVVFVSMTQIFFLMQTTIARINAQREMVAWMSTITQTIATDLENYAINVEESNARTLALHHVSNGSKVLYRLSSDTREGQEEKVLHREVQPENGPATIQTYTSPLFYFSDITLRVTPNSTMAPELRCALLPAVTTHFTLQGDPKDQRLATLPPRSIQTTFSSNTYPLTYSQTCLADPSST